MTLLVFTYPGRPKAKGRPRWDSARRRTFTPASTEAEEDRVAQYIQLAMSRAKIRGPLDEPLGVRLTFVMPDRRSLPDIDNLGKLALDSANHVLWRDDSLIEILELRRLVEPGPGRTRVEVWTLDG